LFEIAFFIGNKESHITAAIINPHPHCGGGCGVAIP